MELKLLQELGSKWVLSGHSQDSIRWANLGVDPVWSLGRYLPGLPVQTPTSFSLPYFPKQILIKIRMRSCGQDPSLAHVTEVLVQGYLSQLTDSSS